MCVCVCVCISSVLIWWCLPQCITLSLTRGSQVYERCEKREREGEIEIERKKEREREGERKRQRKRKREKKERFNLAVQDAVMSPWRASGCCSTVNKYTVNSFHVQAIRVHCTGTANNTRHQWTVCPQ